MELFLPVQQARPCPCPGLEPPVWAPSNQAVKAFPPWELGRAEPCFLGLRPPKGRAGPGLSQLWFSPVDAWTAPAQEGSGQQALAQHKRVPEVSGLSPPAPHGGVHDRLTTQAGGPIRDWRRGELCATSLLGGQSPRL